MNYEEISFGIISFAGDAFSSMREAIQKAKVGDFEQTDRLMKEAKNSLREAHDIHSKILVSEAENGKIDFSILLSHAEDTMMNALLFETIAEEFIDMYKIKK